MPAPTPNLNQGNISRSHTNPFSFANLSLNRTASGRSTTEVSPPYSSKVEPDPSLSSPSGSSALPIWTSVTPIASQAAVISHIHHGNFIQLSDYKIDELIRVMAGKNSKVLETIKIHGAAISGADARLLAKLIRSSEAANIRVLNLDRNAISQDAFKHLSEALKTNKTITTLSMILASVNDKNVKYIAKALTKTTTLMELDLSSNRITATGIEALCDALLHNRTLTRLCLQSNNITKAGAPHLATLLAKNRVIRHLNIGSNGLGDEGCINVIDAVRYNRALTSLSLDLNEMGTASASAMAAALHSNRHLAYLYISNNNIGDQGLVAICDSLKKNQSLIGLDLEMNQLGNRQGIAGMKALADVLKVNTYLREINLSYNVFSSEEVKALMEGVSANSTLESILLTHCGIQTEGALAIAEVLPSAKGLQNLGLNFNPDIEVEGYWALATGLAKNRSMKGMQLDYNSGDRHVLYDSIQKSLTMNFIWQQAVYAATCRILILSRIVLLGHPVKQNMLQGQQIKQQQQQQSGGAWNLLKRVGLGRTNSTISQRSLVTLTKNLPNDPVPSNNANDGNGATEIRNVAHRSISPQPPSLSGSSIRAGVAQMIGQGSSSSTNQQKQLVDQGHFQGLPHHQRQLSNSHSPSIPQLEQIPPQEYNAHKAMAQLGNMPYEIFEKICAYLDPGHNMTIAQIRAAIQAGGTRSTLTSYYTKAKMLEMIFHSRYIPPLGMRYGIKNGDERL
ncbi:hypothetical protein BGZ58_004138 [Dissophora ornata]|nr:hypothetical protein BGZ58_004138 [Dissophora ornata]